MIYTIQNWIFIFFVYSFLGWCFETTLVSIEEKHFINRGFIRSPFLPIYGFGAITMILSGTPVIKDPVLVFIFGAVSATILEFITGWLLEVIFKTRYWDYSDTHYNVKGRICAEATLMWGFMTLLVNYKVHVHIEPIILKLNSRIILILDIILLIIFIIDFIASAKAAIDINNILKRLTEIKNEIADIKIKIKDQLDDSLESNSKLTPLKQKLEQLKSEHKTQSNKISFFKINFLNAHPNFHSLKFNNALTELKIKINEKKKK
ncbi:MAG: hypothetical protein K2F60_01960 [Oscillospiraceae bacterium]|nr:hypothetical protein [Oscillospiraceae bacterium]